MEKEFLYIFTGSQQQLINHPGLDTVLHTEVELLPATPLPCRRKSEHGGTATQTPKVPRLQRKTKFNVLSSIVGQQSHTKSTTTRNPYLAESVHVYIS